MKFCFSLFLSFLLVVSCQKNYDTVHHATALIPESSDLVIRVNEGQDLNAITAQHNELLALDETVLSPVKNTLEVLQPKNDMYISIADDRSLNTFSVVTQFDKELITIDSTKHIRQVKNLKEGIGKILIQKDTVYYKILDGWFLASNHKMILDNNKQLNDSNFSKLLSTSDTSKQATILYSAKNMPGTLLLPKDLKSTFSERALLDIKLKNNKLQFNGVTVSDDSTDIIHVFKNTIPQPLKLSEVIPQNTVGFQRIGFDNYKTFANNISKCSKRPKDSITNMLSYVNEVGFVETETEKFVVMSALDIELLKTNLISTTPAETFRDVDIYTHEAPGFFRERFAPFFTHNSVNYFCVLDTFVVFTENSTLLKSIISEKLNQNTLHNDPKFQSLLDELLDESSYFIFKNKSKLKELHNGNYNAGAVQLTYDTNFAHINGHFLDYKTPARKNSVTEHFSITLDNELIIAPQTVKNHITKGHDIIAQDVNNTLYLITDSGKIKWKKTIEGKILGQVEQIDIYKNGRLQLAFATKNRVYVIDRNGNDVGKFPLKFNDPITQPLSVFDYDNNKNYRLLVTQNSSLLMYDAKGSRIKGFKHKDTQHKISSQPKHFRLFRKDYIVYSQGNSLDIISRRGNIRIPVDEKIRFSGNEIYLHKNQFTTTNTLGELVQVSTKGKVSRKPLQLSENHSIAATSKTLVSLSENKLNIRNRSIDLDFGNYTNPNIFYLKNKIYVSVTDTQANKVYLFDSQAKSIPNFPVFGTSKAQLENLDTSNELELITQTDAHTITVYKLN